MNYERIASAIGYYKSMGYTWVDTPWIVPDEIAGVTFSGDLERCALGTLVGSAEQGFIQLISENKLADGDYVSAGPCFRFGDNGQPGKHPCFFKVELISVGSLNYRPLLQDAKAYMGGDIVSTSQGCDLEIDGIEIGSYGNRVHGRFQWAYGTGLAEPRFSEALAASRKIDQNLLKSVSAK